MSKKIITLFLTILLIVFSFFFTNNIVKISRNNDPIMKEIIRYSEEFQNDSVDGILISNNIIPGIKGKKVNIKKSYTNMKKTGKFEKSMIVFEEVNPVNTITDNYDNFIISGNKKNNNVSLVMEIYDTSYLEEILRILNKKDIKITFFASEDIFNDSIDMIKLIYSFGHDIELLSQNYSIYEVNKYNSVLKLVTNDKLRYCYSKDKNEKILNNCKSSKLHTVVPNIKINNYLYNIVKNTLNNGDIISINNSKTTLEELSSTIDYIHQKGKKIVLLKKLLEE